MRIFDVLSAEQLDELDAMVKSDEDKDYQRLHNRINKIKEARGRDEKLVGEEPDDRQMDEICDCKEEKDCLRCACHS